MISQSSIVTGSRYKVSSDKELREVLHSPVGDIPAYFNSGFTTVTLTVTVSKSAVEPEGFEVSVTTTAGR